MRIQGEVVKDAVINSERAAYVIADRGERYYAVSEGVQAVKDILFLRKGQHIEAECSFINNSIVVKYAKIDIKKLAGGTAGETERS